MQGERWIMIVNSSDNLCFADFLGRPSILKQQYKPMIPQPLQSHPSVWGFHEINSAFHLFKFRKEEITGVHDVIVLSFMSSNL